MEEYGDLQSEIIRYKNDNEKLKQQADRYQELLFITTDPYADIIAYKDSSLKQETFPERIFLQRLGEIRQKDAFNDEEQGLLNQIFAILTEIWNKRIPQNEDLLVETQKQLHDAKLLFEDKQTENKKTIKDLSEQILKQQQQNEEMQQKIDQNGVLIENFKQKISEVKQQNDELINELALQEDLSANYKELFQQKIEAEKQINLLQQKVTQQQKQEKNLNEIVEQNNLLQKKLQESQSNENLMKIEYDNLKQSAKQTISELNQTKEIFFKQEEQLKQILSLNKKLHQQVEDQRTEKQIVQKRSMQDIRDLKQELAKEKSLHEQCKAEREKLFLEVRRLSDLQRNLQHYRNEGASLQERALVESMSHRINELEDERIQLVAQVKDTRVYQAEIDGLVDQNQLLEQEISRLQEDLGSMGAQINQMIRDGSLSNNKN